MSKLFAYLLEQRDAFDSLDKRKRQGLIPDLMLTKPRTAQRSLADVKTLHRGSSTYRESDTNPGKRGEAVARRARQVHREYVRKARRLDKDFGDGAPLADGEAGPVQRKLAEFGRIRGFVFGAVGECSPDVDKFITELAEMGAERKWRKMGARNVREAKGIIVGMARQAIGIAAVRSAARCKLDRLAEIDADEEGGAVHWRHQRFNYDEQRRYRRNLAGHRRAQRFSGPRAHSRGG